MRVPGRPTLAAVRVPLGTAVARAAGRPGYDATDADTRRRVMPMLASEPVAWLSTVCVDGLPHIVPVWFWWDGEALLVFSKPDAVKVRNLRANPRLMVALGRPEDDLAVALIEAEATLAARPADVPEAFLRKYQAALAHAGMSGAEFRAAYRQAIRIVPTRFLRWRGRGAGHAVAAAERPARRQTVSLLPAWA
jgi:PPOX class probable F420-dependent enzyme